MRTCGDNENSKNNLEFENALIKRGSFRLRTQNVLLIHKYVL